MAPGRPSGSGTIERSGDGFAGLFEDAADGRGVLVLMLLAAFGWGALHALSPGHGKAMVAAYLIGTRGTSRDALVLGATVTVTHTIGGLRIDEEARVVGAEGLWAAGADAGGIFTGGYASGLAAALVFGRRAAESVDRITRR